jgi:tight adherence protein C
MAAEVLLAVGLGVIFLGVTGVLATMLLANRDRQEMARRQTLLENFRSTPVPLRQQELETPFAERVIGPLSERFVGAGRRLTPDQRMDSIRRRLDLAGNPPGWDVDRILGLKALGLLVGIFAGIAVPPLFGAGPRGILLTTLARRCGSTRSGTTAPRRSAGNCRMRSIC